VRVNERVLSAEGFPNPAKDLTARGFRPLVLHISEFQKMGGGLSCLSLSSRGSEPSGQRDNVRCSRCQQQLEIVDELLLA